MALHLLTCPSASLLGGNLLMDPAPNPPLSDVQVQWYMAYGSCRVNDFLAGGGHVPKLPKSSTPPAWILPNPSPPSPPTAFLDPPN
mmetsp:Transcript_20097/g.35898  ORF Transcript_20097/g.35898 Transcript_20097/m.35898 type:complete len:86 (+) Transcript_20097:1347-1604(+)